MHYYIDYKNSDDRKACTDAYEFMGLKAYKTLVRAIQCNKYSTDHIHFFASLAGVSGYPVEAMMRRYSNKGNN